MKFTNTTYKDLLKTAKNDFEKNGVDDSERNAYELMGKVLGEKAFSNEFEKRTEDIADLKLKDDFFNLCERRKQGEPLQYLLGEWEFYGIPLKVGKGVLIPRQDTETVVETALKLAGSLVTNPAVADLCSGSGCIALALEKNLENAQVVCVEKSEKAMGYLKENLRINNSSAKIIKADITQKVPENFPAVNMIVCNPPYLTKEDMENLQKEVTFEPEEALFGGEDGLDFYRSIVRIWTPHLEEGGIIVFEIGQGQEDDVMKILIQAGYENVRCRKDLCGINRCVFAIKPVSSEEIAIKVDYPEIIPDDIKRHI